MPGGSSFRTSWRTSAMNGGATKQVTATNTYARVGTRLILALPAWTPSLRRAEYDEESFAYQRKVQRVLTRIAQRAAVWWSDGGAAWPNRRCLPSARRDIHRHSRGASGSGSSPRAGSPVDGTRRSSAQLPRR